MMMLIPTYLPTYRRGVQEDIKYIDDKNVVLTYRLPWQEVVTDLHDVVSK